MGTIFEQIESPMQYDPAKHHRRSIRLKNYDYTWSGWYFVTICAFKFQCIFGDVVDEDVCNTKVGEVIQQAWRRIPEHFPTVELEDFIVMPNHIHGIVVLGEPRKGEVPSPKRVTMKEGEETSPLRNTQRWVTQPPTLGQVIAWYKYQTTKQINIMRGVRGMKLWHRGYYEHIIRNDADLHRIRTYMQNNPLRWSLDQYNPDNENAAKQPDV